MLYINKLLLNIKSFFRMIFIGLHDFTFKLILNRYICYNLF
mgnify:CR=1 FL=1